MSAMRNKLFPTITNLIRRDHTQVMDLFHQYEMDCNTRTKEALVNSTCLALETHAQLEEEIFYPAMRSVVTANSVLDKSAPDHESFQQSIATLRDMHPADADYDQTFMELMKAVMHHVADEEAVLLPEAELRLKDCLGELGWQMARRRLQLSAPHMGEIAAGAIRAQPVKSILLAAGALVAGTYVLRRSTGRHV